MAANSQIGACEARLRSFRRQFLRRPSGGSQSGGSSAAIARARRETAKLNGAVPQAWRADTRAIIPNH